jgi:NAD(P)-dependent dehydrogenase (short-subunit alcohol dehydrogenase family)
MSADIEMDFSGKVALVTGSSRNLGVTIAQVLGERGARVALHYASDREGAQQGVESIRRNGGVADLFQADISAVHDARRLAAEVLERFGRVDILVNNVGPYSDVPFAELPVETWDRVMNSGLRACYLLAQSFAPGMKERGWGHVVNISAGSAFIRTHSVYGLAKAALIHLTESLALELAPEIRVNAVAPGQIRESDELNQIDPDYIAKMTELTPLKRLVTRREVADAVCLVCSDLLPSLTGQTLVLDGGVTIPVGREIPVLNVST